MFKRLSRSPVIPWIGGTLIWAYMSLLSHTLRWKVEGIEHLRAAWVGAPDGKKKGWVAATWHSRILLMPMVQIIFRPKWPKPPHPATLMVSPSKDGEFTRRAGIWLGLHIIRGSASGRSDKNKRGISAAREAMEVMNKGGGMVITIDGPKGPREVVGMGTIKLAQQMGVPIIIYGLSANAKRLDTWDRLLWPRPFARAAVVILEPIPTAKSMDSEELRLRVENALKEATRRADDLCGLPPDTAPAPAPKPAANADTAEAVSASPSRAASNPAPSAAMEQGGS
jgi:lysophospholipid acyltransferase (LPLAT)-like uncharacterized protein